MQQELLIAAAVAVAVPVVLFPPALVWYLIIRQMRSAAQEIRESRETVTAEAKVVVE